VSFPEIRQLLPRSGWVGLGRDTAVTVSHLMAALHVLHVGMGVVYSNECPLSILAAADRERKEAFMRRNQGCISTPVISTPTSRSRFMRWLGNVHRKAPVSPTLRYVWYSRTSFDVFSSDRLMTEMSTTIHACQKMETISGIY